MSGASGHYPVTVYNGDQFDYAWTVPSAIAGGASGNMKVTATSHTGGGERGQIGFKSPSEFGMQPAPAVAVANAPPYASDTGSLGVTFTPQRTFTPGEAPLYIRVEAGDCAWTYEYDVS